MDIVKMEMFGTQTSTFRILPARTVNNYFVVWSIDEVRNGNRNNFHESFRSKIENWSISATITLRTVFSPVGPADPVVVTLRIAN